ncbi:MAG: cytochrome C oxidase subunit IV family protein [bacterium]|nr:cytochrome C oxidase subunit IV family protein [bacterium]
MTSPLAVWVWLVVLVGAGLALFLLPLSHELITAILMGIAAVKAFLVARHYMHLKGQPAMLYAVALVPVVLAIVLGVVLLPDVAYR